MALEPRQFVAHECKRSQGQHSRAFCLGIRAPPFTPEFGGILDAVGVVDLLLFFCELKSCIDTLGHPSITLV